MPRMNLDIAVKKGVSKCIFIKGNKVLITLSKTCKKLFDFFFMSAEGGKTTFDKVIKI